MSFWNKVSHTANRIGYAAREGAKDLVRSYDPRTWTQKDAAQNLGLKYTEGKLKTYEKLVKEGAAVGKIGRVALKAMPFVSAASYFQDSYTFTKGFVRGWQAYGANHR
ncbi:hypothetical protein [Desulfofundulus thermocisternus]|jgi:hypothetical protein|uniref:hypothetical protein n=1 Tax=Desulfofundulus thermocisternus TaxID=42471 RepID=UPI00217D55F0|nr:hypothetical protein [Desulfofundulus thermocisternus]MCS5696747.1 hypothetical protein [Desulfofundulus thermocisternus]MDK2888702.1 hypothetical protein [Thermoanaerobacter sp.]